MADCEWIIICDYAFRDSLNKTCMIGAFDRIFAKKVPATQPQMALAFKLIGSAEEPVTFRVQILRPAGSELMALRGDTKLSDVGILEAQVSIANVQLPDYGVYAVNLYLNEELSKTVSFSVSVPPATGAKPHGTTSGGGGLI
jgi:hypothetical protein